MFHICSSSASFTSVTHAWVTQTQTRTEKLISFCTVKTVQLISSPGNMGESVKKEKCWKMRI